LKKLEIFMRLFGSRDELKHFGVAFGILGKFWRSDVWYNLKI